MADFALNVGLTVVTEQLRQKLIKIIDATKKLRNYGSVFAEPVDYISMNLPDYPEVVKRPMDLQTLRSNLMANEYTFIHQFLKDADLIWSNCRVYNASQQESFFLKAADECEKYFDKQMQSIEGLPLTQQQIDLITANPLPLISTEIEAPMSLLELHMLSKKLADLPRNMQMECVKWYYKKLNYAEDPEVTFKDKDIRIVFKPENSQITRDLDKMVTRKIDEMDQILKMTKL